MCTTVTALRSRLGLLFREISLIDRKTSSVCHQRSLYRFDGPSIGKRVKFAYAAPLITRHYSDQNSAQARTSISSDHRTGALTKHQAKELASKLTAVERDLFLIALKECKSEEDKAGYEGQLAAFRWRSKFGRPSKVPSLGDVDPTGTYCPVPEDWLLRKYVENVPEPSAKILILVAIANAIPFIGFGFLDNFIMIVAGDQIELILNKKFPISTMAAAALGNTVSDVIGIGSVHYVELFAKKVGFKPPKLTPIQLNLPKTRLAANMGRVMGVTIGCLIGMTPIPIVNLLHGNS